MTQAIMASVQLCILEKAMMEGEVRGEVEGGGKQNSTRMAGKLNSSNGRLALFKRPSISEMLIPGLRSHLKRMLLNPQYSVRDLLLVRSTFVNGVSSENIYPYQCLLRHRQRIRKRPWRPWLIYGPSL